MTSRRERNILFCFPRLVRKNIFSRFVVFPLLRGKSIRLGCENEANKFLALRKGNLNIFSDVPSLVRHFLPLQAPSSGALGPTPNGIGERRNPDELVDLDRLSSFYYYSNSRLLWKRDEWDECFNWAIAKQNSTQLPSECQKNNEKLPPTWKEFNRTEKIILL